MKTPVTRRAAGLLIAAVGALAFALPSHAVLIDVEFASNANQYSFVHFSALPGGGGDPDDWLRFTDGDVLSLDLDGAGMLTLAGSPQAFSLSSNNGATASFEFLDISMDLDDTDGFAGGTAQYSLDGVIGTFLFPDSNWANFPFNSSSFDGNFFELFAWGGDEENDLGIDIGVGGTVVPEPATALLLALGLLGFYAARRRRT